MCAPLVSFLAKCLAILMLFSLLRELKGQPALAIYRRLLAFVYVSCFYVAFVITN